MDAFSLIKTLHILGAAVLFGTGAGIAFFMLRSRFSADPRVRHAVARDVVLADFIFTAPAVVLQPVTGVALIRMAGHDPMEFWLVVSYGLFVLTGLCWLPVVWIQVRLRVMSVEAIQAGGRTPAGYRRLFNFWVMLGFPAFFSVIAIFWLMVGKPVW